MKKREPFYIVVGMLIGAANVEVPQKTRVAIWPKNPIPGHTARKNYIWKDTSTPMFIEALFTIAKTWQQPKCPLIDEWIKKMWWI